MFHESLAATTDMAVLPGVLGCRLLRRTVQVRLGTDTLRLPGGTPIFAVSRQQFMRYPGYHFSIYLIQDLLQLLSVDITIHVNLYTFDSRHMQDCFFDIDAQLKTQRT